LILSIGDLLAQNKKSSVASADCTLSVAELPAYLFVRWLRRDVKGRSLTPLDSALCRLSGYACGSIIDGHSSDRKTAIQSRNLNTTRGDLMSNRAFIIHRATQIYRPPPGFRRTTTEERRLGVRSRTRLSPGNPGDNSVPIPQNCFS
jgi:hypothetical protein